MNFIGAYAKSSHERKAKNLLTEVASLTWFHGEYCYVLVVGGIDTSDSSCHLLVVLVSGYYHYALHLFLLASHLNCLCKEIGFGGKFFNRQSAYGELAEMVFKCFVVELLGEICWSEIF